MCDKIKLMMSFSLEAEFTFMDFDLFEVARNKCFPVLNIALANLDIYNFSVDTQDDKGNTLLHYVAAAGKIVFYQKKIYSSHKI